MRKAIILLALVSFFSCKEDKIKSNKNVQIAFMADVHLQDIYGQFSDNTYKGILNPATNKYTLARTMKAQLQSTRLFNENYFAFLGALDDVVKRGVKLVVLPGDFSDDGQAINIRGLRHILEDYSKKYNIRFVLTTGNHDPVRPFRMPAGKTDFLGTNGQSQVIMSQEGLYTKENRDALPVVISKDIAKLGYSEILEELTDFGFYPKESDTYWESPFSSYNYEEYNYKNALDQSVIEKRFYKTNEKTPEIPDVSYLVEPIQDIWFLAIDANVYMPQEGASKDPLNPSLYGGASIGFNSVLTHKAHLWKWIKSVTKRAEELGKTLVVFSHYPTVDFNDNASSEMKELFGNNKMQLHRVPKAEVTQMLIKAGVKVHFGGHMHINDTGVGHLETGSLVNVQIPSLAAYIPAYKLLTVKDKNVFEVETVIVDSVPNFKNLFPLYEQEYDYLKEINDVSIWNKDILKAETYKEFTAWHLKELVRLRFLKKDWPEDLKIKLIESSGKDLLRLCFKNDNEFQQVYEKLKKQNLVLNSWTGLDMIHDFYKIKNADELAFSDIDQSRLKAYKTVCKYAKMSNQENLKLWATIFLKMSNGEPSNHFKIYSKSGKVEPILP